MAPFSKIIGVLAGIAGIISGIDHAALTAAIGATLTNAILAACVLIVALSHALNGNGPATPAQNTPAVKIAATQ